ncbi:GTP pyrophosphokinase [Anaerofustis stercorihominis]|uniref:GTP pyrophosphokinase n=1 Tax=Anaerofustis stercorihominis TaxID=214853 RepID=UPI00214CC29C|nr:GTP pyrophosphokinase family protein [Anaerofustis stercorihominis]MCR2033861.1 GTP pyrophosphokinase family protein [Anaerofustis stercorihominis]
MNMEKDLNKTFVSTVNLPGDAKKYFMEETEEYKEAMMKYSCAIKEVKTKLEVLNEELAVKRSNSPIEFIKSRLKKPESIAAKLEKEGLEVSVQSAMDNLNDIAGIRIVCSFLDDIYALAKMIAKQDDINVIAVKDYIRTPKENGYRSYHMIVEIPVFFSDKKQYLRVEIQIRTIAMDFWATLEHQLKYKKDVVDAETIITELKECATLISYTDMKMQEIKDKIHSVEE